MMISKAEFAERRRALMNMMGAGSIAILPAAPHYKRNRDTEFAYRQDSDFYYLSGFAEPEAVLCLIPGRPQGEYIIFCRERDKTMEIWNGYRAGPEGAVNDFGADDAFPITDIDDILPGLLEGRERVFVSMGAQPIFDQRLMTWVNQIRAKSRAGLHAPSEFLMLEHLLHDLRLFKSAEEIAVMRKAGNIAANAHIRAMKICQPGLYEYELAAEIMHEFLKNGCAAPAYNTIVGGGDNACILHYVDNNQLLNDGDLVLIDAGGELDFYASDITRTFPVNGKFSAEQKAIYELVLQAQEAAIAVIKPGAHWNRAHEVVIDILTQGLIDLGLLQGSKAENIAQEKYREFFMHRTGHWLGMDVHDVGDYKIDGQWRELEVGMVMTVEPGLYIAPDCMTVDEKWRGIGVRIEDDVVVTKTGCEVLTRAVPKKVAEIEALMAR